jgi:hypothetical protein
MASPFETKDRITRSVRDVDLSWNSPHHTLGLGPTQAAPGNHTHQGLTADEHRHDASDIDNLPDGGGTGGDKNYVFTQAVLAAVWTVTHNLNKRVAVSIEDGAGSVIYGTIKYVSNNQITVTFKGTATGKVYCN